MKRFARIVLLIFVVGSIAFVLLTGGGGDAGGTLTFSPETRVAVVFFDSAKECDTCNKIENYALDTVKEQFAHELDSGQLAWFNVDMDATANEDLVKELGLFTKSVVLMQLDHGTRLRWKNLEEVWDLVYDEPAYIAYISENIAEFLGEAGE